MVTVTAAMRGEVRLLLLGLVGIMVTVGVGQNYDHRDNGRGQRDKQINAQT